MSVEGLLDQSLLAELAKTVVISDYAKEILSKIDKPDLLKHIARHSVHPLTCQYAIDLIADQAFLVDIAKSHPHFQVRRKAIERLNDSSLADVPIKEERTKGPETGWMVTERWQDWSIASPEVTKHREEVQRAINAILSDQIVRGDWPFGGWVVFSQRENADRIAALLKRAGCHEVNVEKVRLAYSKAEAQGAQGFQEHGDVWVCRAT